MEEYDRVCALYHTKGLSLREIPRRTGFHRSTIKKMLKKVAPPGYQRVEPPKEPVLGPFKGRFLEMDQHMPPKQRHTAQRVWERLKEEYDYAGGYTQVRKHVARERDKPKEAFVPLEFAPGEAQVDWGEAQVVCEGAQMTAYLFVLTLPFSNARFVACFPRQTLEFLLEERRGGHSSSLAPWRSRNPTVEPCTLHARNLSVARGAGNRQEKS